MVEATGKITKAKFVVNDFVQWFNYGVDGEIISTSSGIILELPPLNPFHEFMPQFPHIPGLDIYTVLADGEIRKFYAKDLLE